MKGKFTLKPWKRTGISFENWIAVVWAQFNDNAGGIAVIIAIIAVIIALCKQALARYLYMDIL